MLNGDGTGIDVLKMKVGMVEGIVILIHLVQVVLIRSMTVLDLNINIASIITGLISYARTLLA